jgi:hypothetical protein
MIRHPDDLDAELLEPDDPPLQDVPRDVGQAEDREAQGGSHLGSLA